MDRQTYRAALERLTKIDVTTDVGLHNVLEVSPHLTEEEGTGLMDMVTRTGKPLDWAAPGLLIHNGFLVLRLFPPKPPPRSDEQNQPAQFSLGFNGVRRRPESYGQNVSMPREVLELVSKPLPYERRAITYAQNHWPTDLILDDWPGFGVAQLRHPRMANPEGYPTLVGQVEFCLTRDWKELQRDQTAPQSSLIESALRYPTLFLCEGTELQGHHQVHEVCCCAVCGAALWSAQDSPTGKCLGCGATFKSGVDYQVGWKTPLPPTLAAMFMNEGHQFETDPAISREFEREAWQAQFAP